MASPHPSGRLLSPAPTGTFTRVDQGVDWANITGSIRAVAAGKISQVYQNLSGFGTTVIETLSSGQQVYYGLETGGGAPVVQSGETVQAGQEIAPGLGSGGIEVGYWNPATGHAAGYQPGVTSGGVTAAGTQFQQDISGNATGAGQNSSLAQLWIQAGGNPALANTMAAIAMAESSGVVDATNSNTNGTIDRGLWQINSVHSQFDAQRLLTDPLYNAQAAVAVEKSQGLGAWTTYTSGAYSAYLGKADKIVGYGGTRPGGQPVGGTSSGGADVGTILGEYSSLRDMPRTAPPGTANPWQWFQASFTGNWDKLSGTGA